MVRETDFILGREVRLFEEEFARFCEAEYAIGVDSGTSALELALRAYDIGPGDEVITAANSFIASALAISHAGATPVVVDIDAGTYTIDVAAIEKAITSRTKAIIPVHLYGHPCDMDAFFDIASAHDCAIIEDAAHALPAVYKGRTIGSMADTAPVSTLTCFSFYATKNMTTAEGGMLTGASELIDDARIWALHGMSRDAWKRYSSEGSWGYDVVCPGFKCNMTDIQAALGLHQLQRLSAFHQRRSEIARRYTEAFGVFDEFTTPVERSWAGHAWHLYVLRLNLHELATTRDQFITELQRRKIGTSVHFIPVHLLSYYRDKYRYSPDDFPTANREFQRIVSLPCYPRMSDEDVADVIQAVTEVVHANRRRKQVAVQASAACT